MCFNFASCALAVKQMCVFLKFENKSELYRVCIIMNIFLIFRAPEPQILDYQMQQYKVFPMIANAYAYWFSGSNLYKLYTEVNRQILDKGNTEMLPEVRAGFPP